MPGTTPVYGFPYPEPTDLVADYPALGQNLAEDIEAVLPTIAGLSTAIPTSIANSGGTASLSANTVTFTGVSSVSLNGVFTAASNNYRVITRLTASSGGALLYMRLRLAGTDAATNYDQQRFYASGATIAGQYTGGNTFGGIGALLTTANAYSVDIHTPFVAQSTILSSVGGYSQGVEIFTTVHTTATAYDGVTLLPSAGTITGTISVYGYKK